MYSYKNASEKIELLVANDPYGGLNTEIVELIDFATQLADTIGFHESSDERERDAEVDGLNDTITELRDSVSMLMVANESLADACCPEGSVSKCEKVIADLKTERDDLIDDADALAQRVADGASLVQAMEIDNATERSKHRRQLEAIQSIVKVTL